MYRNGTNCKTTANDNNFWNVSCTPAPVKLKLTITSTSDTVACTISAAYGVPYFGCTFPSHDGIYESSPATNGIRADPASHADPIPAIETLSRNAKGATIHKAPTRAPMWLTAWTIPCSTLMSCLLTAISNVSVAPMY